jgi:16S rRNA (adenine1518-N6/adenine1519-N6)-dimethyltransferase
MDKQRQTVSFLRQRFQEIGIRPNTKHGQNFLIDLNLVDFLSRAADLQPHDVVLEVGTGTGSLTARLVERAAAVVTVELDQHLSQMAQRELRDVTNIVFLQCDALKNKNTLNPVILEHVRRSLGDGPDRTFKLVANLPYNIATPVISNLLLSDPHPQAMTVTIQKELADRLTATPSTKDYSSLSVWVQSLCFAAILRELPPTVFWPRPKVTSAIVQLISDEQKRRSIPDLRFFHSFVRGLFLHRRKFLRGSLAALLKDQLTKSDIDGIMRALELGPESRAEELPVPVIQALSEAVRQALKDEDHAK